MKIYLSYSIKDFEKSKILVQDLIASKYQVLLDDRSREGKFSTSWTNVLKQKIIEAEFVMFLLSTNSIKSQYCEWELQTATELKKPIIITLLDGVSDLLFEKSSSQKRTDESPFYQTLGAFKEENLNIHSNHDTHFSTITADVISGEGNQVAGQMTILNGAPIWVVGLTAASVIGVTGIVSIKAMSEMKETYQLIFDNVIRVIETIGDKIIEYKTNSTEFLPHETHPQPDNNDPGDGERGDDDTDIDPGEDYEDDIDLHDHLHINTHEGDVDLNDHMQFGDYTDLSTGFDIDSTETTGL